MSQPPTYSANQIPTSSPDMDEFPIESVAATDPPQPVAEPKPMPVVDPQPEPLPESAYQVTKPKKAWRPGSTSSLE